MSFVASKEDQGCADKRTDSRARQHETLLRRFGGPTGVTGAHRCAPIVASWLCVAGFRRVCLCRTPPKEVAILPCYFFKAPTIVVSDGCPLLMGDDYSNEL